MKKVLAISLFLLALSASAFASQGFPYGSNCQGGCGIGSNIQTNTIHCTLYDTNSGDSPIECGTRAADYGVLPATVDPTKLIWTWNTSTAASGCVITGAILNTTDRTWCQLDGGGNYVISTSHKVVVDHLVPAAALGNAGNTVGFTMYLASSTDGSSSNPGGTSPGSNYGNGWSAYPGPVGNTQGPAAYFTVFTPNPQSYFPIQWELTAPGQQTAWPGYPSMIPLLLLWKNGNATSVGGLGPCTSGQLNYLGHVYTSTYAAPNSGTWYTCNGSAWTANGSSPIWVWTATITQGGNTYTCPANANGGVDPTQHTPTGTCTGTAGDSGIAIIPFYAGTFVGSSPQTDYRQIGLANGHYSFDMNGAAPPLNPQPTSVMEVFPATTSITGSMTITLTGTLYTNSTGNTAAAGTTPITVTYPITVGSLSAVTQSTPSFSTDSNLPTYFAYNAKSIINMFTSTSTGFSMDWWNLNIHTWMWYPFGAASFSEYQTWNYDNSRVATSASDQFLHKMDGSAWPTAFTASHTYGDNYNDLIICPADDPNGNCWMLYNPTSCFTGGSCSGTSGGEPSWGNFPNAGQSTTTGTLTALNLGNQKYWNRNVNNSGQPYLNNLILTNGGVSQFSQFTGALDKNRMRTGDAIAKSGTTVAGLYSTAEKQAINGDYGGGLFSPFSGNAGRGAAYELDSLMTYWRTVCAQGNCGAFTNNAETLRVTYYDINSTLNYWDLFANQPEFSTSETVGYGPVIIPFYVGLGTEAIIETLSTCHELDPGSTLAICQDPRMIPMLREITRYMYANWWNQTAVAGEGVSNYSLSYDPRDVQNHTIIEPFFTELTGPMEPAYDWMYAYCGGDTVNCVLPDGTHYDAAADVIREHQYDGRNCTNWTCSGGSHYFGRIWNGGSPNGFGTSTPKQLGQADKWGLGNSYNWRYGFSSYFVTDLTPSRNPCWTGGTVPCAAPTPYADTEPPYMWQYITPGSSGQDDPSAEGHFTGRSDSPIYSFDSTSFKAQVWTFEATVVNRINYGTTNSCSTGSVTTEDSGYPQQVNYRAVSTFLHHFTVTGLIPSTNYFVQFCFTDAAGNQSCNSCAAQSFQGGGINFTTAAGPTQLTITTASLPGGSTGTLYSTTLQGLGGTPPYTWAISAGALPPGLTLNSSSGVISGTPTTGGTYPFTVQLSDGYGDTPATKALSITIVDLKITNTLLPGGVAGTPYAATLIATGGALPYRWSLAIGVMPPGLVLSTVNNQGVIDGTPTTCANFGDSWKVTDGNNQAVTSYLPISITGCGFIVTTSSLPNGTVGQPYSAQLTASGGTGSGYTWTVLSGSLPSGLSLSSGGAITGTPASSGTSPFVVQVTDSGNNHAQANLSITIGSGPIISTTSLPSGPLGTPYSQTVSASGGTTPYSWCVIESGGACDNGAGGALPNGLTIDSSSGTISGTPTVLGTTTFTVQVTDTNNLTDTQVLSITVTGTSPNAVTSSGRVTSSGTVVVSQ